MERTQESAERMAAAKAALRGEMRRRLAGLDGPAVTAAGERLAARLLALPEVAAARRIFLCLSFGGEIDTWALAARLAGEGRQLFVPRTAAGDDRLHVHPYPCELATLSFGLRQPAAHCAELSPAEVDATLEVALVLGLAFDRRGVRLGYGRGYFDRFLAGRAFPTIGIGHAFQLVEGLPAAAHDVPMGVVATDREVHRVGGAAERGEHRPAPL